MGDFRGVLPLAGISNPNQISNLVLDLDADLGITLAVSKVSAWADQSAGGHSVSQGTDAQRPTYVTDAVNGHAVVRFGANLNLPFNSAWAQPADCSVYLVYGPRSSADDLVFDRSGSPFGPTIYTSANFDGDSGEPGVYWDAAAPSVFYDWGTQVTTGYHLFACTWSVGGSTTSRQAVDGAAFTSNSNNNTTVSNFVGLGRNAASHDLESDVARLLIYSKVLSGSEHAAVYAYLKARYATP